MPEYCRGYVRTLSPLTLWKVFTKEFLQISTYLYIIKTGTKKNTKQPYKVIADELRSIIINFGCLAINHIDVNNIERKRK